MFDSKAGTRDCDIIAEDGILFASVFHQAMKDGEFVLFLKWKVLISICYLVWEE